MKLQDKLNAMKKESAAKMPPETFADLRGEIEKVVQSGIAGNAIKVGKALPEFVLPDEKDILVSSSDLLATGPLAISFYRGVW